MRFSEIWPRRPVLYSFENLFKQAEQEALTSGVLPSQSEDFIGEYALFSGQGHVDFDKKGKER
jgi:hypothetical protein